ncbi:MAG: thioredoxin-disulfide reductase [Candidatus Micrarchaeota archaeon]|nr:thioredoxin-disulfide reductase [Candidatus Micrarchaeota archaeon]
MGMFDISYAKGSSQPSGGEFDVVIIGAGPAGLASAIYASRAKLKAVVIDKGIVPGGQIATTSSVEDYPGIERISGEGLGQSMKKAAESFGAIINLGETVKSIKDSGKLKQIETGKGKYSTKAIIFAAGARFKKLGVPGEDKFFGKGVSFCAVCDAPFFKGKNIIVIGGGNSAVEEALYLTKFAGKVTIMHRRDKLKADKVIQDRAFANKNISYIWDSEAVEVLGNETLTGLRIKNTKTNIISDVPCDGIFVYVGMDPNSDLVKDLADLDEQGYIMTNERMETRTKGLYAAGDVRKSPFKQAITASGDGAIAAHEAEKFIEGSH